ncbi:MAG: hypothetical protein V7746_18650 [Halioglobus sp.]
MNRTAIDWFGNIMVFTLAIAVNALATSLPLGGQTPPEISARYPSLFTPAGFTFSIWAVIYLGLFLFVIYQSLPGQRNNKVLARIDKPFKINCLANTAWILAWHYDFLILSVLIMLIILASLIVIYREFDHSDASTSLGERMLVQLPFRLYTAWITVATIANISTVQNAMGFDNVGTDAVTWTLFKLALAGAVVAAVAVRKADAAFIAVIAWAAYGISIKQAATPAVAGAAEMLCILAIMLALPLAVYQLLVYVNKRL